MDEYHAEIPDQLGKNVGFYCHQNEETVEGEEITGSYAEVENRSEVTSSASESRNEVASTSNYRDERISQHSYSVTHDNEFDNAVAINFQPSDIARYISTGRYDLLRIHNIRLALTTFSRRHNIGGLRYYEEIQNQVSTIPCTNYARKSEELLQFITRNNKVADLKLSFYMVACEEQSYLKPFPNHLVEESDQGHHRLMLVNEEIPCINLLEWYLSENNYFKVQEEIVSLLHWLFISLQDPKLKCVPPENFLDIYNKVESASNYEQPSQLFRAMYGRSSPFELKWQALKGERKSKFAFYSDSLNNMHSLIHLGFHPSVKTDGLCGSGIYLFSDLKKCMEYSGPGWAWGKSAIGTQLKTVLVIEFLVDPDIKILNEFELIRKQQKALTSGPNTKDEEELICYFVPKAELIRIRYVCIYVKTSSKATAAVLPLRSKRLSSWFRRHKKAVCLFGTLFLTLVTTQYLPLAATSCSFYVSKMQHSIFSRTTE